MDLGIKNNNFQAIKSDIKNTGKQVSEGIKTNASRFDTFVKNNKNAKFAAKASITGAISALAILSIKRMIDKFKEIKDKD